MKLSAVVITKNEEKDISACLESLRFCDELIVIDSHSTDNTVMQAKAFTDKVFIRSFDDFSTQKNFGVTLAMHQWILSVDADERISQQLADEIKIILDHMGNDIHAYALHRINFIFGKKMRFGANRGDRPVRLFHKEFARFEGIVHERLVVDGKIGVLREPLFHHSTSTAKEYIRKLNQYTRLESKQLYVRGITFGYFQFCFRPLARFFQRYVLQLGFLDGAQGFFFALLSSFYDFVKYAKLWELERK